MHEVGRRSDRHRAPWRRSAVLVVLASVAALVGVPATAPSAGAATTGYVAGSVIVNGRTDVGVGVLFCPGSVTITSFDCPGGSSDSVTGRYGRALEPGTYSVAPFAVRGQYFDPAAPTYFGPTTPVTVTAGDTTDLDLHLDVAAATGSVVLTRKPAGLLVQDPDVRLCPESVTVTANCPGGAWLTPDGGQYLVFAGPAGAYSLAGTYQYAGRTVVGPTTRVALPAGSFTTVELTMAWQPSGLGDLTGTFNLTGLPAGAEAQPFLLACPGGSVTDQCAGPEPAASLSFFEPAGTGRYATLEDGSGGSYPFSLRELPAGTWTLLPGYELTDRRSSTWPSFSSASGSVTGTPVTITVVGDTLGRRNVGVPWLAGQLGRVAGTVTTSAGTAASGTIDFCPGTGAVEPRCAGGRVATSSGDGAYEVLLPAGTWSGRARIWSNDIVLPDQFTVTVAADVTVTRDLVLTSAAPATVQGTVTSPTAGFEAAVWACPGSMTVVPPDCPHVRGDSVRTATTSGSYRLDLPPGTWSITVGVPFSGPQSPPATVVTVGAGQTTTRALTYAPEPDLTPVVGEVRIDGATTEQAKAVTAVVDGCPGSVGVAAGCPGGFTTTVDFTGSLGCRAWVDPCVPGFHWSGGLHSGVWSLRASYVPNGASAQSRAKVQGPVTVLQVPPNTMPPTTLRQDLSVARAASGTLTGTLQVTGRNARQLPVTRVDACPGTLPPTSDCAGGVSRLLVGLLWLGTTSSYSFELPAGTWSARMRHSLNGRGWVSGDAVTRTVASGSTAAANLTAPAQAVTTFDRTFTDVPPDAYYADAAEWMKSRRITGGIGSPTTYGPDLAVTRGQMAAFLWRLMGSPTGSPASGFTDVPAGAFYAEATRWLKARGITTGYGGDPTRFAPDVAVTRSQMATFLWRLAGSPAIRNACVEGCGTYTSQPRVFTDVPSGVSYEAAVNWLWAHGITTGLGSPSVFGPAPVVTRAQMAAFIHRLARDQGLA